MLPVQPGGPQWVPISKKVCWNEVLRGKKLVELVMRMIIIPTSSNCCRILCR